MDNKRVAAQLNCAAATVGKWRARFVADRLDGLVDEPRSGRPPSISAEQVEAVVVATLEATPTDATHWSRASMAAKSGLSKTTIGRIWKAFDQTFFSKGQPCLRASDLGKKYGWGIHSDGEGRVALFAVGSPEYRQLEQGRAVAGGGTVKVVTAMRSSRR